MDWLTNLNNAIDYIEAHLLTDIDVQEVAKIAGCSKYHFNRMFSYIAGISLSEYIRRRRLTLAALELQTTDDKVADIALKYGYESPTAFNRAFQAIHGLSPSKAKESATKLKAYMPISFSVAIKGDTEMTYRIEEKPAFTIAGAKTTFKTDNEANFMQVPMLWQDVTSSGKIAEIGALIDSEPYGILGVSDYREGNDAFDYYIAASTTQAVPDGMESLEIGAHTWAIFESVGPMPEALQTLQKRMITEWLPTSGYSFAQAPDIEVYGPGDQSAEDYRCEAWLPITK